MAGMIDKSDVEKVRAAADLYDIVSSTVTLKSSGTGTFVGLCPFHDEKTPSFNIRPALGVWHCFGCGLGGDVFAYVQQRENVDFREAVELLADRYHIELHYANGTPENGRSGSKRSRLLEANEEAERFFTESLASRVQDVQGADEARAMLEGRNFAQGDWERFGCGYAPKGWDNLVRRLADRGFTQKEMIDAGLARQGQRGVYDYFRGRVTWPIRDSTGRTLGFGARRLFDDDAIEAKYINTPDTALYRKTQVLYGLDIAKPAIVRRRQAVVVEGYTDVMACHLAGVDTAVATCGTAFGAEHAKMIRRLVSDDALGAVQLVGPLKVAGQSLSSRVVFTFDGDAAGQKAAIHAFSLDSAFLSQTFVAVAQDNLDPCDLRIRHGDEAVRALVAEARPLYDFVIDAVIDRFDLGFATGRMGAVKAVAPLVAQIRDMSLLDMYTRKATRRIGVDLDLMRGEVLRARRRLQVSTDDAYAGRERRSEPDRAGGDSAAQNRARRQEVQRRDAGQQSYHRIPDAVFICEQQFMAMLIQRPDAVDRVWFAQLTLTNFITPVFRSMFQAVAAAGGLPAAGTPQGLWMHELTKAAGPVLGSVIDELAVMPLPLPSGSEDGQGPVGDRNGRRDPAPASGQAVGEGGDAPSQAERQYASELLVRLIDLGYMRRIGAAKRRMAQLGGGNPQSIELLGDITRLEKARRDLSDQVFGNAVA
ncbi:DNA primase [uncultured Bifidobacterium sp.]|uniref:DNA primase n=1 Tax=uncultured Bifidobacterium sp. TaxID=165187 RepID=UPI0028DC4C2A|nr:DNA primase [uncultured Bifidobacterium sp.]